jgi:MscS family membrane protein
MKHHLTYCRRIILLYLIVGIILPAFCSAQGTVEQKKVESNVETPANPDGAIDKKVAPPPNTPLTKSPSDVEANYLEQLWNKIDPETLWKDNGIIAWAFLLGYIFAGMVLGKIVSVLLLRAASSREGALSKTLSDMAGPANLALLTLGIYAGLSKLTIMGDALKAFKAQAIELMFTITVFWYLYNLIGLVDPLLHHLSRNSASALDKQVAPLVRRSLRVFLIILTLMYVFKVFGADIGAWLAGLGIAGIAVSLAAQDSLKNLFGSITIILDRPFKIGDRIICTGYEGVIEDIGFRSTKVRTSAGHLVSIPNANVVNSPIENISRRPGIRRNFSISLPPDTQPLKVKQAAQIVRDLLADTEFREPIHCRLNGETCLPQVVCGDIVNNNLMLTVTYWYAPPKSADFNQHSEKLTLRILEAFEKAEIPLATPK